MTMDADTARAYLRALVDAPGATTCRVASATGETERQARRRLEELRAAGLAFARRGEGGGWRPTTTGWSAVRG